MTKNAFAYIRVSTNMQEELSPDAQIRLVKDYAHKNNILITKLYIENGVSGRKAEKRPEFMKMIADAKNAANDINVILVWKFSRFARNQEESIVYKSLLKKQHDIDVISVSEPLIEGPFGSLIERIIEWMDEYYSIRLSGEVVRGMTEKALRGGYQANPPLGYQLLKGDETPTIIEAEAEIIRHIFSSHLSGHGSWVIANELNTLGYRTKRKGLFQARSIGYILRNPFYAGNVRWNYFDKEKGQIKASDEIIITKGLHEAIISENDFNQAQYLLDRKVPQKKRKPSGTYKHWLSGIVKCYKCGHTMSYSHRGKWEYLRCSGFNHSKCDNSHGINLNMLQGLVLEALKEIVSTKVITFTRVTNDNIIIDKSQRLILQIEKLKEKEMRIKEAYRNGVDTLEEYKENKRILQCEADTLQSELEKLEIDRPATNDEDHMLGQVKNVYEIMISDADVEIKSDALKSIVDTMTYDQETKILRVKYRYNP